MRREIKEVNIQELYEMSITDKDGVINYPKYARHKLIKNNKVNCDKRL
jgi:hypothetical protein